MSLSVATRQLDLLEIGRIHRSRLERVLDYVDGKIQLVVGCCEPGYEDKPVAMADWNDTTEYNPKTGNRRVIDRSMPRIAKILGKMGYEVEWEDEWHICEACGKAVRCQPDCYAWKAYYWLSECTILCGNCVKSDPTDYLAWLSGSPSRALTLDIDLAEHGYVKHSGDYESGHHPGQTDNPKRIAAKLREEEGITDFIFSIDDSGQFDITFSVWVKK